MIILQGPGINMQGKIEQEFVSVRLADINTTKSTMLQMLNKIKASAQGPNKKAILAEVSALSKEINKILSNNEMEKLKTIRLYAERL